MEIVVQVAGAVRKPGVYHLKQGARNDDALKAAGGPTPTQPLKPGSPALDAGNPAAPGSPRACETTDQRGAARPASLGAGRCDVGAFEKTTACVGGGPFLCLSNNRFQVVATWKTAAGATGSAQGVELTPDSGYFWFFDRTNVELTLKVLNACSLNNRYWVFLSGLTDVQVTLTVTDTQTGSVKIYTNPLNHTFTNAASLAGQTVRLRLSTHSDTSLTTSFWFDTFSLQATACQ